MVQKVPADAAIVGAFRLIISRFLTLCLVGVHCVENNKRKR